MNEERNPTFATCNPQPDGEVLSAQTQIGSRALMKSHLHLNSLGRAMPQVFLPQLVCIVTLAAGLNWTAATDQVPYTDAYQAQRVSVIGADQVFVGGGTGTYLGKFTNVTQVHVGDAFFDPVSGFVLLPISGTAIATAANGDKLFSSFDGFEVLDFSQSGPLHFAGSQQITGGTGRFTGSTGSLAFSGFDYGDGNISVITKGTISTVGSN